LQRGLDKFGFIETPGSVLKSLRHPAVASLWRGFVLAGAPKLVERRRPHYGGQVGTKSNNPLQLIRMLFEGDHAKRGQIDAD